MAFHCNSYMPCSKRQRESENSKENLRGYVRRLSLEIQLILRYTCTTLIFILHDNCQCLAVTGERGNFPCPLSNTWSLSRFIKSQRKSDGSQFIEMDFEKSTRKRKRREEEEKRIKSAFRRGNESSKRNASDSSCSVPRSMNFRRETTFPRAPPAALINVVVENKQAS